MLGTRGVIPAQAGIQVVLYVLLCPAGQAGILGYLLDSRLRGNDMPGLAHWAVARCFIWLKSQTVNGNAGFWP